MRTSISILLFCMSFPYYAISQYQDLMKNKDITWIAEFEMDLSFDLNQTGENTNVVKVKKFLQPKGTEGKNGEGLTQYLYKHIVKGEVLAYETSSLNTPFTIGQILNRTTSTDTVITFDPATSEEQFQTVKNELDPSALKICRTKQAIYFNSKTGSLGTCLVAISPLLEITGPNRAPMQKEPLGWIKMDDLPDNVFSENLPTVNWAASIEAKATPLDFSQLKVVKGALDFRNYLYEDAISESYPVEDGKTGYGSDQFITKKEVEKIYAGNIDSVIRFDPATYEENVQIIVNDFKPSEVNHCWLVQDWFYIPEKKLVTNRLKAIAPIIKVIDYDGQFRFFKPLYYIRY